ncbi:MAG: S-adenosylmethionine transporter [Claussenomyces sp. TS43310]|nr:MAG: S-adenosylmethionine transporter [Claussenomyces sp. TS43310]
MSSTSPSAPSTSTTSSITPFTTALLAGGIAGTTVDLSLFPLDTLKTRLQSPQGFLATGGFSGIYAGVGSAIIGSAPGAALFFVTYEYTKTLLSQRLAARTTTAAGGATQHPESDWTAPLHHMVAASLGEVAACAVRVPTEVVKQRAQARQHPSSLAALSSILALRPAIGLAGVWRELYRGWAITVFREVPFTVIQFPLWEALKSYRLRRPSAAVPREHGGAAPTVLLDRARDGEPISAVESAVAGSLAGAVAAGITTPLDVLKTRMMLAKERVTLPTLLRRILRDSGPRAFFAGIGPRIGWISAGGAIFLGSYQWAHNKLEELAALAKVESRGL